MPMPAKTETISAGTSENCVKYTEQPIAIKTTEIALERISKPPFERLASNLRSVLIKEVISYGMYKEG